MESIEQRIAGQRPPGFESIRGQLGTVVTDGNADQKVAA
jgi:hypothetical protein